MVVWNYRCIFIEPEPPSLSTMLKSGVVLFLYPMENQGEIILYQPDNEVKLEVRLENETVWLNRGQLAELFARDVKTIGKHVNNALKEELAGISVVAKFATTATDGKVYQVEYYNLDMVLSIGYRVKSSRGIEFRRWANKVLKEYLLKGHAINYPYPLRTAIPAADRQLRGRIGTADAQQAECRRESRHLHTGHQPPTATGYAKAQQPISPIGIHTYKKCHDRFLIIDGTEVYHIGASLKDLGKKMFAFSKLEIPATTITALL